MITELARVINVDGKRVEIQVLRESSCHHCALNTGCGTGAIGRLLGGRSRPIIVETDRRLSIGDTLTLGLPEQAFFSASLLIYGLPLAGLVVGALLGQYLFGSSEMPVLIASLAGFATCMVITGAIAKNKNTNGFNPQIIKVNNEP